MNPKHPDLTVDVRDHNERPLAAIAMVRRTLQKAGHASDALHFTEEALSEGPDQLLAVAERYVVLINKPEPGPLD